VQVLREWAEWIIKLKTKGVKLKVFYCRRKPFNYLKGFLFLIYTLSLKL
jgi:hypothetical protein